MRIAHLSDLHILELKGTNPFTFFNKRMTGAVNLALRRAHHHHVHVVEAAFQHVIDEGVDHIVVTGDLSNLSLESEFEAGARLLRRFGDGRSISVIPGNHDNYTYTAARRRHFDQYFAEWITSDLSGEPGYPYVKLFDGVAIVGLSSSLATAPIFATGHVSRRQLGALRGILERQELRERFIVAMVHHPLGLERVGRLSYLRRLTNADELKGALVDGGVGLLLHGHDHRTAYHEVPYPAGGGTLYVCEAGSTSLGDNGTPERSGKLNIYDIRDGALARVTTYRYVEPSAGAGHFEPWTTRNLS